MSVWIVRKKCRQDRVTETAFVVVSDINDCLLLRKELGKLLVAALLKRVELRYFECERIDFGEDQSRFLSDELRV